MIFAAPVWHFWIAVVLMITLVVPSLVALVAMYLNKVERQRYPSVEQQEL